MNKQTSLLLVLGIGGAAMYYLLKPKSAPKVVAVSVPPAVETGSSIAKIEAQIKENSEMPPSVDPVYPQFGVPEYTINASIDSPFANFSSFKNYVDVKENHFFQPKLGMFHK